MPDEPAFLKDAPREIRNMIARELVNRWEQRYGSYTEVLKAFYFNTRRPDGTRVDTLTPAADFHRFALEDAAAWQASRETKP
jgi:hypothetical protein